MKKDFVHLAYALTVLVFAGALEELAPRFLGVAFPVLLSATVYCSLKRKPVEGLLFALAAGAAEDSLASLPLAASVSFFVVSSALIRGFKLPPAVGMAVYPAYQLWIWIWLGSAMQGNILLRIFAAFPVGAITVTLVWGILYWLDRKAGLDEK